jgi:hypothetical protein
VNRVLGRVQRLKTDLMHFPVRFGAWRAFQTHRHEYHILLEPNLRATRKSDTVFIFGSGSSLNDIDAREWQAIGRHDTIGFNWFVHERFVRCDYHLVREIGSSDLDETVWRPQLAQYSDLIRRNPHFANTVFLVQTGFRATNGNRAIGLRLLPAGARVFLWRSRRERTEPTRSLTDGLAHAHGTLAECVNFAYLLGWRRIVLAGVDLYDRRYFWLPPDQPVAGDTCTAAEHRTARSGLIDLLGRWRGDFLREGVELFVYNPRSLLAESLPVWPRVEAAAS